MFIYTENAQRTQITFYITRCSTKPLMHPSSISTSSSWSVSWISMLRDYLIHKGLQLLTIKNTWFCSICLKSALFSAFHMACKILLTLLPINQKCQLLRLEYSIYTFLRTVARFTCCCCCCRCWLAFCLARRSRNCLANSLASGVSPRYALM